MTKNTKEVDFNEVPNLALVKERIYAINPNVEFVKAGQDKDFDTYTLRLQLTIHRRTDLCLPENLLNDLCGKNNDRRNAQLDQEIRTAMDRMR